MAEMYRLLGRARRLTRREREQQFAIFGAGVHYDAVRIFRGSPLAFFSATAVGNAINLRREHFSGDGLELSALGETVLIHELAHVWQFQNFGWRYIPASLVAQMAAWLRTGSRRNAYRWQDSARAGIAWSRWNPEQQAQCISDYASALAKLGGGRDTVELARPYAAELCRSSASRSQRARSAAAA
jgi:hypothetical protein